jgi:hypothetical protein
LNQATYTLKEKKRGSLYSFFDASLRGRMVGKSGLVLTWLGLRFGLRLGLRLRLRLELRLGLRLDLRLRLRLRFGLRLGLF